MLGIQIKYQYHHQEINMYERRIQSYQELPIPYHERRHTDICCCVLGFIFGLIMFIVACATFNRQNLVKVNFPSDKTGAVCLQDPSSDGQLYPLIFFNDIANPLANRYCLKHCPVGSNNQCRNGPCSLDYYPNQAQVNRLGAFCMPTDQKEREKLLETSGMNEKYQSIESVSKLMIAFGISLGLGLLWMILVQCFPKTMIWVACILAPILLVILGIVLLVNSGTRLSSSTGWAIILGIIAFVFALLLMYFACRHGKQIKTCGIFLQNATLMLKQSWVTFLYIPLFIGLSVLFCMLIVFQFVAYMTALEPTFRLTSLYYSINKPFFGILFLVVETLWGLAFLRNAFDYCVSGHAVQWYFKKETGCCQPLKSLICKHFGSVVSGSILSAFLYIPDLFASFCCVDNNDNCFDLLRGDTYPYIYLTGSSYCNAARQCQYLCSRSAICHKNQSNNAVYSLAAGTVLSISTVLITFWLSQSLEKQSAYVLLGAFFMSLYITCYFIDIHVDVSEALLISFLAECDLGVDDYTQMECRDTIKYQIQALQEWDARVKEEQI